MYVLLVRPAGTESTLHGSPSRSQPCRSIHIWSRHAYVWVRRMVSRDFESGYIADAFEMPNWDPDSGQATRPTRRYRHIPCCIPNTINPQYPTSLSQTRGTWAMPAGCPGIHRIKPNISSGPSSDREDPPQTNSRLMLSVDVPARCTPQVSIPGLS